MCQWAQKVNLYKFASFQPKIMAVRAFFQESLLKLGCDVEYYLGYIFSVIKIFLPHPWEKIVYTPIVYLSGR